MTDTHRMARITGLAYLGLAVSGMAGYLTFQRLYAAGDAARTAENLIAHEGLARFGIIAVVAAVLTQAATAVSFWRLFRPAHPVAAGSITAFGMVNCVTLLVSVMFSATALGVALRADATSVDDAMLLYDLSASASTFGHVFFGLWLVPMGWLVGRSGHMPRPLGWILVGGGTGYVLSVLVASIGPRYPGVTYALTVPATVGEVWMIGYLLTRGVTPRAAATGRSTGSPVGALT